MSSAPSHPAMQRRLSVFLSLAPTTSDSYPQVQRSQQQQQQQQAKAAPQPLTDIDLASGSPAAISGMEMHKRRSSSLSSTGSKATRFLKLGPVHWGEHMEEHQSDFAVE